MTRLGTGILMGACFGTATDASGSGPASAHVSVAPVALFWPSQWPLVLGVAALALSIYLVIRTYRSRMLAIQRLRTRIATDLHDDLGASLSQVAIMCAVVSRRTEAERQSLDEIAGVAREALQSMSEIVWSVDPRHDRLCDLTQRMRWFAGETLAGPAVTLNFRTSEPASGLQLRGDTRQQVFLIFKECVNNIARHAGATSVNVLLTADKRKLELSVEDNGRGFDPQQSGSGNGLRNMAQRAASIGARLEVHSHEAMGSRVVLTLPLIRRSAPGWRLLRSRIDMRLFSGRNALGWRQWPRSLPSK